MHLKDIAHVTTTGASRPWLYFPEQNGVPQFSTSCMRRPLIPTNAKHLYLADKIHGCTTPSGLKLSFADMPIQPNFHQATADS